MAMQKSRFTEEQIPHALRQAKTGTAVTEVCRGSGLGLPQRMCDLPALTMEELWKKPKGSKQMGRKAHS